MTSQLEDRIEISIEKFWTTTRESTDPVRIDKFNSMMYGYLTALLDGGHYGSSTNDLFDIWSVGSWVFCDSDYPVLSNNPIKDNCEVNK